MAEAKLRRRLRCPSCSRKVRPSAAGRCPVCRELIAAPIGIRPPDSGGYPAFLKRLSERTELATQLARVLPLRILTLGTGYGLAILSFFVAKEILGPLFALGSFFHPFLGLGLATFGLIFLVTPASLYLFQNGRELILIGMSRSSAGLLAGRIPITHARFYSLRLRGRRAFAVHVTFGTEQLSPQTRVQLRVWLQSREGKPLAATLPRYQAPDGEFLARELSPPLGHPEGFTYTLGAILPVRALELPGQADEMVQIGARVELLLEGVVQAQQELTTSFRTRAEDYPTPLVPRDAEPIEFAAPEEVTFLEGTRRTEDAPCPVCGEAIRDQLLTCLDCHVPHHPECWAFAGKCSTYGCLGDASAEFEGVSSPPPESASA